MGLTEETREAAEAALPEILAGMEGIERTVVATTGPAGSESAPLTLTWSWEIAGQPWSYDTEGTLTLVDGAWVAAWDPALVEPTLGEATVLDATTVRAARGDLIGARGEGLVVAREVVRFGIDRTQVPADRAGASARRLAKLVGVDVAPYVARVEAAGDAAFVEAIVFRKDDVPLPVVRRYDQIKGARALSDTAALGPTPDFAVPLLGRVGPVTAEMVDSDPDRFRAGDVVGLSGLEQRYDEQLTGTDGAVVTAVASDGKERDLFRVDAVDPDPLLLTMDAELQLEAERLLADVGPAAALVAIRPSDGAVLAAANGPGTGGVNIATFGQAAPGSTFKIASSLALLRAGRTPDSSVECPTSIVVDGKTFTNYDDYPPGGTGRITLRQALANSCNTAFIGATGSLRRDALADAAASLGLGIDHEVGFPAYFGQVPPPESATGAAAASIGQGTVLASPMAMATVMASVVAGQTVVPHLVESVTSPVPEGVSPLTGGEAESLRSLLRSVVTSGSGAGLLDVPGPPVIAKTGTAEFDVDGERKEHAWMVAGQGDLAVAVYVDVGESGSRTAGPILEAFLRAAR